MTERQGADQAPWPRDPDQYPNLSEKELDARACEALDAGNVKEAIDLVGHLSLRSKAAEDGVQVDAHLDFRRALDNIVDGDHLAAIFALQGPNDIELDGRRRALRLVGEGLQTGGEPGLAAYAFHSAKDPRAAELMETLGTTHGRLNKQFAARWTEYYRAQIEEDPTDAFALYQNIVDISGIDWGDDDDADGLDGEDGENEIPNEDLEEVRELAYDAIREPAGLLEVYRDLAQLLVEYEREDAAMKWAELAARVWPDQGEVYYSIASTIVDRGYGEGRDDTALEAYRRSLAMEYVYEYADKFANLMMFMGRWKELADLSEHWFNLDKPDGNQYDLAPIVKMAFAKTDRRLPEAVRIMYRKFQFSGPRLQLMLLAVGVVCLLLYFAFFHR